MWYRNVFAEVVWPWQSRNPGAYKEKAKELQKLYPGLTDKDLIDYAISGKLGELYKADSASQNSQTQLANKNYNSAEELLKFINSTQNLSKDLSKALEILNQRGFKVQGKSLNEVPELLQIYLGNKTNIQLIKSEIFHKNFSSAENAMYALSDDSKARGVSIFQSAVDADKNGFKINNVAILQHPMFSGAQEKLEAMTTNQQQNLRNQPQQGPQNV
jgi:hypothetical protein